MANCNCESCPVSDASFQKRRRLPAAFWVFVVVAAGTLVLDAIDAHAEVYHSRESALELAFPDADSVTTQTLTLSVSEADEIGSLAGVAIDSRLVRVYEAWEGGLVTARGIIDTHNVRSLPETLLVVADTSNRTQAVHLLAFHEPVQYEATPKWLSQFDELPLGPDVAVRRGIAGIAGATMTSNAITAAVRRCLATFAVAFPVEPALIGK